MTIELLRAISGARLALDTTEQKTLKDDGLAIVLCEKKSTVLVSPGIHTIWCSVFDDTEIVTSGSKIQLHRGDIAVGDSQIRHNVLVANKGAAIGVAGTSQAWLAMGEAASLSGRTAAMPFPAIYRQQRRFCRRFLRLVRQCPVAVGRSNYRHFAHLLSSIVADMQAGFVDFIDRCPGSTLTRKRAVFMRLQRVRNHIVTCAHEDIDIRTLAHAANYSVGHFITIFRSVFGETPYSSISRLRLKTASSLLSCSDLGVSEIAQSIGFSSQSSFSRAMRMRLGKSATEYRAAKMGASDVPLPARKTHATP